jgi:hypothetical protein
MCEGCEGDSFSISSMGSSSSSGSLEGAISGMSFSMLSRRRFLEFVSGTDLGRNICMGLGLDVGIGISFEFECELKLEVEAVESVLLEVRIAGTIERLSGLVVAPVRRGGRCLAAGGQGMAHHHCQP